MAVGDSYYNSTLTAQCSAQQNGFDCYTQYLWESKNKHENLPKKQLSKKWKVGDGTLKCRLLCPWDYIFGCFSETLPKIDRSDSTFADIQSIVCIEYMLN